MAWSKAAVSAAELANLAADHPCLLGTNVLRSATLIKWTTDGNHGSAVSDAAGYPGSCAGDDFDHAPTKPNGSATTWYLNILLASATDVDALVIKDHNLSGHQVDLQIADDAAFGTRLATICTFTPASNKREVRLVLKESGDAEAQRFTGLTYVRVKVSGSSFTPSISEVVLSRRRQLPQSWKLPVDTSRRKSVASLFVSDSGIITSYRRYRGQREVKGTLHTRDTTMIAALDALWDTDTEDGSLPWWWIESPSSAPSDGLWLRFADDTKSSPTTFGTDREFALDAVEQGPNFLAAGY